MDPSGMESVVLLAEGEVDLQRFIITVLRRHQMTVLSAAGAAEALALSRTHSGPIDLLVAGILLDGSMDGMELAERIVQERPAMAVLLISGSPEADLQAVEKGLPLLSKPFTATALMGKVRGALARSVPGAPAAAGAGPLRFSGLAPAGSSALRSEERRQLEARLLDRVRLTAQAYRTATAEGQKLIEHSREIGWDTPDGSTALRKATAAERIALEKYSRALKSFNNLIVHGRKPARREMLESLLDAALETAGADKGSIEVLDPAEGVLRIEVQRGFEAPFVTFFERVSDGDNASGEALRTARRVIVEDVLNSPWFDRQSRQVLLDAGVRAVQSTPLLDSAGGRLGVFSTHYANPTRPTASHLQRIDELAAQASELLIEWRRS